jgi:hypothetical protein
MAAPDCSCHAC